MKNTFYASYRQRSGVFNLARRYASCLLTVGFLLPNLRPLQAATATVHRIYNIDEVQAVPVPKREVRVRFSREARKEHGKITLRFVVTAEGKVTQLTVMKFSDPEMVEPAYDAYNEANFSPGIKDGKPVDTWVVVTRVAN